MIAKELISEILPALRPEDNGLKALNWMETFRVSHLPVVRGKKLLGVISDSDIYDLDLAEKQVNHSRLSLVCPYVYEDCHIYEVIAEISKHSLTSIPVLNRNNNEYTGQITLISLSKVLVDLVGVKEPGGIIVLQVSQVNYSLTQIAQIIESNDAKILSLYVRQPDESNELDVTLKINKMDLSEILQTFTRYDYHILGTYMDNSEISNFYQDRLDEFKRYFDF